MEQRAFDTVPVVISDDPNDAAVLLLAHFPSRRSGIRDAEALGLSGSTKVA